MFRRGRGEGRDLVSLGQLEKGCRAVGTLAMIRTRCVTGSGAGKEAST